MHGSDLHSPGVVTVNSVDKEYTIKILNLCRSSYALKCTLYICCIIIAITNNLEIIQNIWKALLRPKYTYYIITYKKLDIILFAICEDPQTHDTEEEWCL